MIDSNEMDEWRTMCEPPSETPVGKYIRLYREWIKLFQENPGFEEETRLYEESLAAYDALTIEERERSQNVLSH